MARVQASIKVDESLTRTVRFQVRVSPAEKALMDVACQEFQLTLSELVRHATLSYIESELGVTLQALDGRMDVVGGDDEPGSPVEDDPPPPPPV